PRRAGAAATTTQRSCSPARRPPWRSSPPSPRSRRRGGASPRPPNPCGGDYPVEEHELPTWNDILGSTLAELDHARNGLSDAASWLRSDWRPLGSALSEGAGDARLRAVDLIGQAKTLIDQAKGALHEARNGTGGRPR